MRLKNRFEEFDSRFGIIMQDMLIKTNQDDEGAIIISADNLQNLEKYFNNVEKRRFNDMLRLEKLIKSLEERVEKQEEAIKALVELCKPLIQK